MLLPSPSGLTSGLSISTLTKALHVVMDYSSTKARRRQQTTVSTTTTTICMTMTMTSPVNGSVALTIISTSRFFSSSLYPQANNPPCPPRARDGALPASQAPYSCPRLNPQPAQFGSYLGFNGGAGPAEHPRGLPAPAKTSTTVASQKWMLWASSTNLSRSRDSQLVARRRQRMGRASETGYVPKDMTSSGYHSY